MRILWLSWKDMEHPLAGGAEVVTAELASRLAADGHEVVLITGGFDGAQESIEQKGCRVIRVGGRISVYWQAYRYIKKQLKDWPDIIIEEVNTIPFFSRFYMHRPRVLFFHQLAREIWFHQMALPFSAMGYCLEPLYLRLIKKDPVVTVSESSRKDLMHYGFRSRQISVIPEGIQIQPVADINKIKKYQRPTMLSLGAMRAMKRTLDQVKAFEIAKRNQPSLKLKIAGDASDSYGRKVLEYVKRSPYKDDIEVLGRVSSRLKTELMQRCHFITVTSIKEGWGLIVTEAASQGTPAVVYDVDGLRDSVRHDETGLVTAKNSPAALAESIVDLLSNEVKYERLRKHGWVWSGQMNFAASYQEFKKVIGRVYEKSA